MNGRRGEKSTPNIGPLDISYSKLWEITLSPATDTGSPRLYQPKAAFLVLPNCFFEPIVTMSVHIWCNQSNEILTLSWKSYLSRRPCDCRHLLKSKNVLHFRKRFQSYFSHFDFGNFGLVLERKNILPCRVLCPKFLKSKWENEI